MMFAVLEPRTVPVGSGFFIVAGLAVFAKHVAESVYQEFGGVFPAPDEERTFPAHLLALLPGDAGAEPAIWRSTRVWTAPATDVGLVALVPHNGAANAFHAESIAEISALPPRVGETVTAFGHIESTAATNFGEATWELNYSSCEWTRWGPVEEVELNGPQGARNFPWFRFGIQIDPGMSGGPVFDETGRICGMNVSGWELLAGESPFGYAALAGQILQLSVNFDLPDRPAAGPYRLADLRSIRYRGFEEYVEVLAAAQRRSRSE